MGNLGGVAFQYAVCCVCGYIDSEAFLNLVSWMKLISSVLITGLHTYE